jgi:hypothetical protein
MSKEPVRLLETADLPRAERELLDAGRALAPTTYDVAAGALRFRATLEAAGAASTELAPSAAKTVGLATAGKITAVLLASALVAAIYYALQGPAQVPPAPSKPASVTHVVNTGASLQQAPTAFEQAHAGGTAKTPAAPTTPRAERSDTNVDADRARVHEPEHEQKQRALPSGPRARERATPSRATVDTTATAPTAPTAPTAAQPEDTEPHPEPERAHSQPEPAHGATERSPAIEQVPAPSIDELHAIARARALLPRDPEAALELLTRIAREHPRGYFVEERAALTIVALDAAGKSELAEERAKAFLRAYPRSPHAGRVRAVLSK